MKPYTYLIKHRPTGQVYYGVRSANKVNPQEDLAFYFNTYIEPKYGLGNINVNNCASFMKELEMNWTKLTPELKDRVLDILVDGIFTNESDFKNKFINKLGVTSPPSDTGPVTNKINTSFFGKSNFGASNNNWLIWVMAFALAAFFAFVTSLILKKR